MKKFKIKLEIAPYGPGAKLSLDADKFYLQYRDLEQHGYTALIRPIVRVNWSMYAEMSVAMDHNFLPAEVIQFWHGPHFFGEGIICQIL